MTKTVRIGCASGFWGDSFLAAPQLVRHGRIDYLVFDYLAEITMSIMARARAKDANAGYATDFVTVTMRAIAREVAEKKIKVIANAGGVNAAACAAALEKVLAEQGAKLSVAYVTGDDILESIGNWRAQDVREMFTGAPLPDTPLSMNAYLGGFPVAAALAKGADVVITGRCVDSAVTLGACIHEFGWKPDEYDKLAGGSLAGHIVECGAQACGGLFTDWREVPDWSNIGYAIAEVSEDGSFVATKPEGTGGLVTRGSVGEQLLYEIGDPQAYMLPDVVCDFSNVTLEEVARDRVRVSHAKGFPPTHTYKVSVTHEDGYRVGAYLTVGGLEAEAKARRTGDEVLKRLDRMLRQRDWGPYEETSLEVVGSEDSYGAHKRDLGSREAILKLAAKHPKREALELLVRELTSSGTSMAPGTGGMGGSRARVSPVVRHFACLIPKREVAACVHIGGEAFPVSVPVDGGFEPSLIARPAIADHAPVGATADVPLIRLAYARSGDKGNNSNIGIMARRVEYMPFIRASLTADAVARWFAHKFEGGNGKVERFDLPGLPALNFLLHDSLGGGGIASLSNDPQGKAYGQMLLDFPVKVPAALAKELNAA